MYRKTAIALAAKFERDTGAPHTAYLKDIKNGRKNWEVRKVAMVEKTNLMTGEKYFERDDTPPHMSPACETYWCM